MSLFCNGTSHKMTNNKVISKKLISNFLTRKIMRYFYNYKGRVTDTSIAMEAPLHVLHSRPARSIWHEARRGITNIKKLMIYTITGSNYSNDIPIQFKIFYKDQVITFWVLHLEGLPALHLRCSSVVPISINLFSLDS